ncbi:DinB family protein [Dinghuibacter silviterrae]|uniref:DinB family protein n=1 Tax=Dinghuibacter silviterrae TaxID=1539049 RepID=A0A4R8DFR3_9BACT|nr:DinB family protein [Dinghuibacter silviterrae]TDW96441.1 DinB family protein [Dinghuibacter silviterrae]
MKEYWLSGPVEGVPALLQLSALKEEGLKEESLETLLDRLDRQVEKSLAQLAGTDPATFTDFRGVGRAQLPSTVMGLLFHAAEHTMRHTGQLLVTVRWVTTTFA